MGCTETRSSLSAEEYMISAYEKVLGFSHCSATRIDFVMRKFARNGLLNSSHFADAAVHLNLQTENSTHNSKITQFYQKFLNSDGLYVLRHFLVLGILLGYGQSGVKATLLFEAYDYQNKLSLTDSEVRLMLTEMFEIACVRLPSLVSSSPEVEHYLNRAWGNRAQVISQLTSVFTEASHTVSRDVFVKKVSGIVWQKLLKASGFRSFFAKAYMAMPGRGLIDAD